MYLGIAIVYLGFALQRGVVLAIPLLVAPLACLNFWVIPFEEQRMRDIFGQQYADYCSRVRRWL
jgi:protein-S-isoprenylcysteine O-methyltransferase Ste14